MLIENWDAEAGAPVLGSTNYRTITRKIEDYLDEIDFEVKLLKKNGHEYISLSDLIAKVKKHEQPVVAAKVYALSEYIEAELRSADKIGYADTFRNNREYVLKKVFGPKDRSFVSFSKADFKLMEEHLNELDLKPNTMSMYLRTFYRVWNVAIKEGMCPKELHPKKFIKFQPYKKYKTSKRAISATDMKLIESFEADFTTACCFK